MSDQDPEIIEPSTGELVRYEPPAQVVRAVDMRNVATDSWTDIVRDVAHLADHIANTEMVPKELRGNAPAIAGAVLYGRELGLPPMTSLQGVAMVKGRPSLYAETMRALILQAGHELQIEEATEARCVISGRRKGSERWTTATWTMADAQRAGIAGAGSNYGKYPRQMLLARASVELARMIFADVIHGMRGVEELIDELDTVTEPAPAPPTRATVQRAPRKAATQTGEPGRPVDTNDPAPLKDEPPTTRKRATVKPRGTSALVQAEAGTDSDGAPPPAPSGPSLEQQQSEIRRLSEQRRQLRDSTDPAAEDRPAETPVTARDGVSGDEPEVSVGRDADPKITNRQNGALMGHWGRLGMMQDRDERLLVTNLLLGLEPGTVNSTSELTSGQAVELLKVLERLRNRDELDQKISGQSELIPDE